MATLLGPIPAGQTPQQGGGAKLLGSVNNIDQSSATLAHSQQTIDQLRVKQQQAQQASQVANAPATIAKETTKGALGSIANTALNFARSAIHAPVDIANSLMGKQVDQSTTTGFDGKPMKTIQAQGADMAGKLFDSGASGQPTDITPLGATADLVGQTVSGAADVLGAKGAGEGLSNLVKKPFSKLGDFLTTRATKKADEQAIQSLHETLAPKLNAKEVKLALKDGRIVSGQDPTLLKGGTPDQIMPSESTQRAAATIHKQIPKAGSMKAPELYNAVDARVKEIGQSLRPVMDSTPISQETTDKIMQEWKATKIKQLSDPYAPATANVGKLQVDFEKNFLSKVAGHFGNLWDTRIAYDASVPASVKNATSLSSETLQTQKSLWLQNRSVLNHAINDSSTGLGDVSQSAFSEMNDMYNAQKGIESSFKPTNTGESSKIMQLATHPIGKEVLKAAIPTGIGAAIGTAYANKR